MYSTRFLSKPTVAGATGRVAETTDISSRFWRPEVQYQGVGRLGYSEASVLGLQTAVFPLCPYMVPLCVSCVLISSSRKDTSQIELGLAYCTTSLHLNHLFEACLLIQTRAEVLGARTSCELGLGA